jgi:multidrug resistance efflux pump
MLTRFKKFIARNNVELVLATLVSLGFTYYFYIHREPRTDNAFVVANIRPVSSLVEGHITHLYVLNNQQVKKGDKLFSIYNVPYELAIQRLQSQLEATHFSSEATKERINSSTRLIDQNTSKYKNARYISDQVQRLYKEKAISQREDEQAKNAMDEALASVDIAKSNLLTAQVAYLQSLADIKNYDAQLSEAKVNLQLSTVYAESNGLISNMFLSIGTYAAVGKPLFSLIDTDDWWIQGNFEETDLSYVKKGQTAEIRLWMYPKHIFNGTVESTGWNVQRRLETTNAMSQVTNDNPWFRLPQRFPVQIKILNGNNAEYPLHVGASATVTINVPAKEMTSWLWYLDI